MEYPFSYYGHSGTAPPLHVPVRTPALRPKFPAPGREYLGPFGFSGNYSKFFGRLRSSRRTVLIKWAGTDRLTVSRHFHSGSLIREITRSKVFAFDSAGASLTGLGRV
jgi:hypothetical protein